MDYYQILAIIGAAVLVIASIILTIFIRKRRVKKETEEFPGLLEALGGLENIEEVSYKGSRVSIVVDNKKNLDKEKIKDEGVDTIVISNKKVTLVVGSKKAPLIASYLKESK